MIKEKSNFSYRFVGHQRVNFGHAHDLVPKYKITCLRTKESRYTLDAPDYFLDGNEEMIRHEVLDLFPEWRVGHIQRLPEKIETKDLETFANTPIVEDVIEDNDPDTIEMEIDFWDLEEESEVVFESEESVGLSEESSQVEFITFVLQDITNGGEVWKQISPKGSETFRAEPNMTDSQLKLRAKAEFGEVDITVLR